MYLNEYVFSLSENSKFIYEPGKTYDYQYESDLKTWVNGGTEEHSSLHMRATVQMEVLSRCEMVLKVLYKSCDLLIRRTFVFTN